MSDCTSMILSYLDFSYLRLPFYFMRSQKRTYTTDAAKNAMVTVIQRTSCIGISSGGLVIRMAESESNAFVGSVRNAWPLGFNTHFYELSAPPGRIELCELNRDRASRRSHSFFDESCQHSQQKNHCADAQHCQRNSHSVTGAHLPLKTVLDAIVHPHA
jgi:hypothetical protein